VYTQCSQCETVFKLSAEMLRAAGGQVRCGRCGTVFNALANLAEERSAFPMVESQLAMEKRADTILETAAADILAQPAAEEYEIEPEHPEGEDGVEIAHLEITDFDLADFSIDPSPESHEPHQPQEPAAPQSHAEPLAEPWPALDEADDPFAGVSLEFTLPPGELDRIFVESKRSPHAALPRPEPAYVTFDDTLPPINTEDLDIVLPAPDDIDRAFAAFAAASNPVAGATPEPQGGATTPTPPAPADAPRLPRRGLDVPEEVRSQILAIQEPPSIDSLLRRRRSGSPGIWVGAAVALALLLAGQLVHQNREWLAARGPWGRPLRAMYAAVGVPIGVPANLSVYQLRQWGVTGDPGADGTLRVRASILNASPQPQPHPLLRVNLANRFGTRIGARDFDAAEYLGHPVEGTLKPGERVDATMEILDPGREAEGFEIDICLRGVDKKISCANDLGPAHTKR
jgi:predicted Zn finger-like uncharacterized protein